MSDGRFTWQEIHDHQACDHGRAYRDDCACCTFHRVYLMGRASAFEQLAEAAGTAAASATLGSKREGE